MAGFADLFKSKVKITHEQALEKILKDDAKSSKSGPMNKQAFVVKALASLSAADKKSKAALSKADAKSLGEYETALRAAVGSLRAIVKQTLPAQNKVLHGQAEDLAASLWNLADAINDLPKGVAQMSDGFAIDKKKMAAILVRQKKLSAMADTHLIRQRENERAIKAMYDSGTIFVEELKVMMAKAQKFDKDSLSLQNQFNDAIADLRDLYPEVGH